MLSSAFDSLREQLLRAGIAPRHVRRYIGELRDHFDDLTREEIASGASQSVAKVRARNRLGSDADLADVMLARPELRSLAARHPLMVFGLGPVAMVVAALAVTLATEIGVLNTISAFVSHPSDAQREIFVFAVGVWNTLATTLAPLAIATALCIVGLRQRVAPGWIFAGIVCACFFGAFQEIHFADDGHHGSLSLGSAFAPPFPMKLIVHGFYRAVVTITLAGAAYWFGTRLQESHELETGETVIHAAE
jgi:hypothetical protein